MNMKLQKRGRQSGVFYKGACGKFYPLLAQAMDCLRTLALGR